MFLLILDYRIVENIIMTPLNSIMFLLIRQVLALYPDAKIVFKFLYVSINSTVGFEEGEAPPGFKFHYVSINSFASLSFTLSLNPLNSIMFLLILQNNHLTSLAYMPLNSIMFLLIPCLIYGQAYEKGTLNSIMFLLIRDSSEIPFDTIIL